MTPLLSVGLLLALVLASIKMAGGALVYTLDDPYIHLALARNIQEGSYGINLGEWASPSSSIAWPFLLALVPARWIEWGPLLINGACCLMSVHILHDVLKGSGLPDGARSLAAVAVGFGLNLFGLVMTGMEHSLQVCLVMFVAHRLLTDRLDRAFYLALAVMPLVRYECLAISLPVATYLWFARDKTRPALAMVVTLGVMCAFSVFLYSKGLPLMPSSIIAKTGERSVAHNLQAHPVLFAMLAWLVYFHRAHAWRCAMCVVLPLLGFMVQGRVGWFGRYEAFMVAWMVVFTMHSLVSLARDQVQAKALSPWQAALAPALMCAGLVMSFPSLWRCTVMTPLASQNIAQQQALMARVARELGQPVAVNDLGLVALRSGQYVLDLWGLGSIEALRARQSGLEEAVWMEQMMVRKGVQYAFIYEHWFPQRPANWIKVGELTLNGKQMTAAGTQVSLLARTPQAAQALAAVVARLAANPQWSALIQLTPPEQRLARQAPGAT